MKDLHKLACLPVGDPTTPPRRAGARGPGIELIGDCDPDLGRRSTKVDHVDDDSRLQGDPTRFVGYFAYATAANGADVHHQRR